MPERRPDNELIDGMGKAPSQQGSGGGALAQAVGKRAEEKGATEDVEVERVTGADKPRTDILERSADNLNRGIPAGSDL